MLWPLPLHHMNIPLDRYYPSTFCPNRWDEIFLNSSGPALSVAFAPRIGRSLEVGLLSVELRLVFVGPPGLIFPVAMLDKLPFLSWIHRSFLCYDVR